MVQFIDEETGYLQWVKKNTQGFVLNCYRNPTPGYLMLQRADCYTIIKTPANGKSWTSDYRKICSLDPKELQDSIWDSKAMYSLQTFDIQQTHDNYGK